MEFLVLCLFLCFLEDYIAFEGNLRAVLRLFLSPIF
jgi:hypothetical protein